VRLSTLCGRRNLRKSEFERTQSIKEVVNIRELRREHGITVKRSFSMIAKSGSLGTAGQQRLVLLVG